MTPEEYDRARKLCQTTIQIMATATEGFVPNDDVECPLCIDCPMCHGTQEVKVKQWDYDPYSASIQIYGVGEDLDLVEDFVKESPALLQAALDEIDRLRRKMKELNEALWLWMRAVD